MDLEQLCFSVTQSSALFWNSQSDCFGTVVTSMAAPMPWPCLRWCGCPVVLRDHSEGQPPHLDFPRPRSHLVVISFCAPKCWCFAIISLCTSQNHFDDFCWGWDHYRIIVWPFHYLNSFQSLTPLAFVTWVEVLAHRHRRWSSRSRWQTCKGQHVHFVERQSCPQSYLRPLQACLLCMVGFTTEGWRLSQEAGLGQRQTLCRCSPWTNMRQKYLIRYIIMCFA